MSPFLVQDAEVLLGVGALVLLVLCFLRKEDPKMALFLDLLANLPADDVEKEKPEPTSKAVRPVSHLWDSFA
jgi:recombinational DNA repair protein (RecF pathway)